MMGIRIAVLATAAVVTVGSLVVPVRAQRVQASTELPATVEALISELANSMGMLRARSNQDRRSVDSILTLEHWASGSLSVGEQRFDVPEYRMSINFSYPGMRVDYTRAQPSGASERRIEVLSGDAAWNESERGMNATAASDQLRERLVHLWTTPFGVVKAAATAGPLATMEVVGETTLLLSFPLPDPVSDVTVNATVRKDASLLVPHPEALMDLVGTYLVRVETTGAVVSETTFAEYGDQNWDDYRADIMLPKRITRTQGDITWVLTTTNTNTYNPYVVMPVPANVAR
jgi:hypothetical protein